MNAAGKGWLISTAVHGGAVLVLLAIGTHRPEVQRLVVDFTLEQPPPAAATPQPVPRPERPGPPAPPTRRATAAAPPAVPQKAALPPRQEPPPEHPAPQPVAAPGPAFPVREGPTPVTSPPAESAPAHAASAAPAAASRSAGGASPPPAGSAGTGGGETAIRRYITRNFSHIRDLVYRHLSYPTVARKMGWQGKVLVSFIVCADGKVKDVAVAEGSGKAILDNCAMQAVRNAAPFPGPGLEVEVRLPVKFILGSQ